MSQSKLRKLKMFPCLRQDFVLHCFVDLAALVDFTTKASGQLFLVNRNKQTERHYKSQLSGSETQAVNNNIDICFGMNANTMFIEKVFYNYSGYIVWQIHERCLLASHYIMLWWLQER